MQRRQRQIQPTDLKAKAVGVVVRELREQAGHSQERLSADCGFDRTYISRVERGILNPTVSRLWRIADVLETPLSQTCQANGTVDCQPGARGKKTEPRIGSRSKSSSPRQITLTNWPFPTRQPKKPANAAVDC